MPSKVHTTGNNCELLDCIRRVRLSSDGRFRNFHHILLCIWKKLGLQWHPFALKTTTKKQNKCKEPKRLCGCFYGEAGAGKELVEKANVIRWTWCGTYVARFWCTGLFSVEQFSSCSFPFPNISHLPFLTFASFLLPCAFFLKIISFLYFFKIIHLFSYWLCWVFIAVQAFV